jgi:hypothetical protein
MDDNTLSSTEGPIAQACRMLLREGLDSSRGLLSRGIEPKAWPDHFEQVMRYVANMEKVVNMGAPAPIFLPLTLPLDSGPINPSRAAAPKED